MNRDAITILSFLSSIIFNILCIINFLQSNYSAGSGYLCAFIWSYVSFIYSISKRKI